MSTRADDLEKLKKDFAALNTEVQGIQGRFAAYDTEVTETIKTILTDAGVYEEVRALEMEREGAKKDANVKLSSLQGQMADIQKMASFLVQQEPRLARLLDTVPEAPEAPEVPPSSEAPALEAPEAKAPEAPEAPPVKASEAPPAPEAPEARPLVKAPPAPEAKAPPAKTAPAKTASVLPLKKPTRPSF